MESIRERFWAIVVFAFLVFAKQASAQATILLLSDASGPGTTALASALTGVGNSVTVRPPPENAWDGTNPSLAGFNCVVHLDGATFSSPLPVGAQTLLETFVNGGGGFIGAQWDGYERAIGQQTSMNNLVLQLWADGATDNCGGCTITYTTVPARAGHPVLTGIPSPFSFFADGHDAGSQVIYGVNPSTVLMTAPSGGPAVLVRQFGSGRVVNFSHAANYGGTQLTLQNANIQALYINAVGWACNGPFFGGGGGCPPHRVHGHISTVPPTHIGTSHEHHGQHGHLVPANCPPHSPGHSSGLLAGGGEWVAHVPAAQSESEAAEDPAAVAQLHPIPGYQNTQGGSNHVRAGDVVEFYGPSEGLFVDENDEFAAMRFKPPASEPLYYTTRLPEVRIGDVLAQVLFSGLAPGQTGVWQINVIIPANAAVGEAPVTISYGGEFAGAAKLSVR